MTKDELKCSHSRINLEKRCIKCGIYLSSEDASKYKRFGQIRNGLLYSPEEIKNKGLAIHSHLLKERKFALILDLDQTVLDTHTCSFPFIMPHLIPKGYNIMTVSPAALENETPAKREKMRRRLASKKERTVGKCRSSEDPIIEEESLSKKAASVPSDLADFLQSLDSSVQSILKEREEKRKIEEENAKLDTHEADMSDLDKPLLCELVAKSDDATTVYRILTGPRNRTFLLVKLRPGIREFITRICDICRIYVFTKGSRSYATMMVNLLDPLHKYIQRSNVFAREDLGGNAKVSAKSLSLFLPPPSSDLTVILDDCMDVWPGHVALRVEPYRGLNVLGREILSAGKKSDIGELKHMEVIEHGKTTSSVSVSVDSSKYHTEEDQSHSDTSIDPSKISVTLSDKEEHPEQQPEISQPIIPPSSSCTSSSTSCPEQLHKKSSIQFFPFHRRTDMLVFQWFKKYQPHNVRLHHKDVSKVALPVLAPLNTLPIPSPTATTSCKSFFFIPMRDNRPKIRPIIFKLQFKEICALFHRIHDMRWGKYIHRDETTTSNPLSNASSDIDSVIKSIDEKHHGSKNSDMTTHENGEDIGDMSVQKGVRKQPIMFSTRSEVVQSSLPSIARCIQIQRECVFNGCTFHFCGLRSRLRVHELQYYESIVVAKLFGAQIMYSTVEQDYLKRRKAHLLHQNEEEKKRFLSNPLPFCHDSIKHKRADGDLEESSESGESEEEEDSHGCYAGREEEKDCNTKEFESGSKDYYYAQMEKYNIMEDDAFIGRIGKECTHVIAENMNGLREARDLFTKLETNGKGRKTKPQSREIILVSVKWIFESAWLWKRKVTQPFELKKV
ncbi:CTD phosphatase Fcp1 like protein [Aduncisulcus paluster]|uniref:protein-serine/threonine phosphatase n=1 Tax=Aduncisulcus paluster TaxID=2918883 RepID=A0ABQ5K2C5_9EUKA|nr:CTD phosphatase Fcp1 like protein [Aduncisulcus paluster]